MNWSPWVRSLTHVPVAWTNSPALIEAAAPTHGDQIALAADLDPQHAEAGLGAVEGHPLDQPGEMFDGVLCLGCEPRHQPVSGLYRRNAGDASGIAALAA